MKSPVKLLLIEDCETDAELVKRYVQKITSPKFEITHVSLLNSAIEHLNHSHVDIILTDLGLPDSLGIGSLEQITSKFPHIPMVILSGTDSDSLLPEATRLGIQDYLVKSDINTKILRRTMFYAIEKKDFEQRRSSMKRQLQHSSKLAAIGQLAAGVGHEINNPLAIVKGHLDILRQRLTQLNIKDDKLTRSLNSQAASVQRIKSIVQGLRTYARADTDHLSQLDLNSVIKDTLQLVQTIYENQGTKFLINLTSGPTPILGNTGKLQQVIMNLVNNAQEACGAESHPTDIKIESRNIAGHVGFTITDNGKGIPLEDLSKVFDSFYSTKDVGEGTGLGLSIAQSLVIQMNGTIELQSRPGVGTSLTVEFPASEMDEQTEPQSITSDVRGDLLNQKHQGQVLVVDDEPEIRELLSDLIESFGFEVDTAANGQEGLDKLSKKHYDQVFTDLKMPIMDGEAFIRAAQKLDLSQTKIHVVTGGIVTEFSKEQRNYLRNNTEAYILKPFSREDILAALFPSSATQVA